MGLTSENTLLNHFTHHTGADGTTAFSDGKTKFLFHRDRRDQFRRDRDIISGHDHLYALGQLQYACHVRCPKIKLGTIARKKRRVATTLFLAQNIHFRLELRVRRDALGMRHHLTTLYIITLGAA